MAFELAARVSALGEAVLTRFLHVSGSSYCVYTAATTNNTVQFYHRAIPAVPSYTDQPVPGSETAIGGSVPFVRSFYVLESTTVPGQVVFLYDDDKSFVWRFVYDFVSETIVQPPTQLFQGQSPVMTNALGSLVSLYLRVGHLQARVSFGAESTIIRPSGNEIESFTAKPRSGLILQYAGAHNKSMGVPTKFRTDSDTELMYVIENAAITDLSGNGHDASYASPTFFSTYGVCFAPNSSPLTCGAFPFPSAITTETWLVTTGYSRSLLLYSGPISLTVTDNELWTFAFGTAAYRARLPLALGQRQHVAVSHTFGSGAGTFIAVNGRQLPGSWVSGTGNETPSLSGALSVLLGPGDLFQEFKVSRVAKSIADISSYIGGLS
jgi:hypothetical protein